MPKCQRCGLENPSIEVRQAAFEAEHAMSKYTGFSTDIGEDWCACCDECGGNVAEYKCTCRCPHGLSVYDNCESCLQRLLDPPVETTEDLIERMAQDAARSLALQVTERGIDDEMRFHLRNWKLWALSGVLAQRIATLLRERGYHEAADLMEGKM